MGAEPHEVAADGEREHAVAAATPVLLQHDDLAAAARREHDVAGAERVEPGRVRGRGGALRRVEVGDEPAVLLDVAGRVVRGRGGTRELLARAFELPLERHDVAVGVVLRERQVQEVPRLLGRVPPHEVGGHVVRRAERRRERVRAARREPGHLFERDERVPEHDDVAAVVDAAAAGAPRELRVLAGRQELVVLAGELRELLDDDGAGRHVDAERQRLGREHDLEQPRGERLLDRFLHRRHHARVVRGEPGLEPGEPRVVAEHVEVVVGERGGVPFRDLAQLAAFGRRGQPQARGDALVDGLVAAGATEHEHDRRQHLLVPEPLDDLAAPRRVQPRPPATCARAACAGRGGRRPGSAQTRRSGR